MIIGVVDARIETEKTFVRVNWYETRRLRDGGFETFFMIAEKNGETPWRFYERSTWEVNWYDSPSCDRLIQKVSEVMNTTAPDLANNAFSGFEEELRKANMHRQEKRIPEYRQSSHLCVLCGTPMHLLHRIFEKIHTLHV